MVYCFYEGGAGRVEMIVRHIARTSIAVSKIYGSTVGRNFVVLLNVRTTSSRRSTS